jgi:hypothetical protein
MTRKIVRSIIPLAPEQYSRAYIDQLARALDLFIDEQRSAQINFQGIKSSGAANTLNTGDFFEDDGIIKIVRENDAFAGSNLGTTSTGTVTVVIS